MMFFSCSCVVVFVLPSLGALAVDDLGSRLVVLILGDPHLLEGGQGGEDRSSNPDGVLALRWCDDLNGHGLRGEVLQLLLETLVDLVEHSGTSRHDNVSVEILTDIDIALHDGVESELVDSLLLETDHGGLEENLRAAETLVSDGNNVSVGKLVVLLDVGRGLGGLHLSLEVHGAVAQLLLHVTNDFALGRGGEVVSTLVEDLLEVGRQVTSGEIQTKDSVGE